VPESVVWEAALWAEALLASGRYQGRAEFGGGTPLPRDTTGRIGEIAVTALYLGKETTTYPREDTSWDLLVGNGHRALRIDMKTWSQSSLDSRLAMCLNVKKHHSELKRPIDKQSNVLIFTHLDCSMSGPNWAGEGDDQRIHTGATFTDITVNIDGWARTSEMAQLPPLITAWGKPARTATPLERADLRTKGLNWSADPRVAAAIGYETPLRLGMPAVGQGTDSGSSAAA
jgi:hypothetical protein